MFIFIMQFQNADIANKYIQQNQNNFQLQQYEMKALMINPTKNIMTNKMRDQMYLKHLMEVQKINNREADSLKKQYKQYKSISEIHNKYKVRAKEWQNLQNQRLIEQKNKAINNKVKSIKSVFNFGRPKTINPLLNQSKQDVLQKLNKSRQNLKQNQHKKNIQQISRQINESLNKSINQQKRRQIRSQSQKHHSLHYRYRKKQQQLIEQQNERIVKAIMSQRSCIDSPKKGLHSLLPHINGSSSRYQTDRSIISNSVNYTKSQIEKEQKKNDQKEQ